VSGRLRYCGRSMSEGLVGDPQAKEHLYWQLTGTQVGCGCGAQAGPWQRVLMVCDVSGRLPYCGCSTMEGLTRDLQAKEYLYWQLTGTQVRSDSVATAGPWRRV
jgi:hypothetical protein